tara:strand:- start:43209 stop:44120 length:912 start_codon:yes stop_codon:yes gene_type:complete
MPIIVTGASGLIGFAVASELVRQGIKVIGTDIIQPPINCPFPFFKTDIRDAHALYSLIKNGVEGIIHCGGISGPMLLEDQPHTLIDINICGTANVLEAARVFNLRRVIYCSSTSAYGNTPTNTFLVDETAPLNAVDVYGASKAAGDILSLSYSQQHQLDTVSLRFSWVYGPRRRTECILRKMILDARIGKTSKFNFGRKFKRQYIYIDDVVNSIISSWNAKDLNQHAYNITGGTQLNFEEISQIMQSVIPDVEISNSESDLPGDLLHGQFDISAAQKDLGYKPLTTLDIGIKKYATWLKENEY